MQKLWLKLINKGFIALKSEKKATRIQIFYLTFATGTK